MDFGIANAVSVVGKIIGFILLVVAYMYLDKLEKIGCACAEHPYRKSIKKFLTFAIAYFLITTFLPPAVVVDLLGPVAGLAYVVIDIVFTVVALVFFVLLMRYTKYLSVEKCKCSEGNTREILYIYSIIEVIMLSLLVILPIVLSIGKGAFALAVTTVKDVQSKTGTVTDTVFNPLKAAKSVPRAFKNDAREILSLPKTAVQGVKKVFRK
jgi:hypothetical protein